MPSLQDIARKMVYPGRFLILGNDGESLFHFYGVTARSEASRAKRYVYQPTAGKVVVVPTDTEIMAQGDLSLLDYTAAHLSDNFIISGNGRQTDRVKRQDAKNAQEVLRTSLVQETYEDDNYRTPRITGCSLRIEDQWTQALHIIRSDEQGGSVHDCYEVPTQTPSALFLSTYAGPNIRPTPSFIGEPYAVTLPTGRVEAMAREVYEAFAPQPSQQDLRVSVVLIVTEKATDVSHVYTINAANSSI